MKARFYKWEGVVSLLWIVLVFLGIVFLLKHQLLGLPLGVFLLIAYAGWWGIGLILAISGVKQGHWLSRVCAGLTICAFFVFTFAILSPVASA